MASYCEIAEMVERHFFSMTRTTDNKQIIIGTIQMGSKPICYNLIITGDNTFDCGNDILAFHIDFDFISLILEIWRGDSHHYSFCTRNGSINVGKEIYSMSVEGDIAKINRVAMQPYKFFDSVGTTDIPIDARVIVKDQFSQGGGPAA